MALGLLDELQEINKDISSPEQIQGKGLLQPFNITNSSSRKIMFSTQIEHAMPLMTAEIPLVQTGWENEFGRYSASLKTTDTDYQVYAKIEKFTNRPQEHYWLVLKDANNNYDIIERIGYCHTTETYGYPLNNTVLDSVNINDVVRKDTTIQKSLAYDDYNNRMDGVNLITAYLSIDDTQEDGIVLSRSATKKLVSPLYKKVMVIVNTNDLLLNLYGDQVNYKSFPDIGEHVKGGILLALRREKKEERLFTQSFYRLSELFISDDKFTVEGRVVDIDVYCNNPELLSGSYYNQQLNSYYLNSVRLAQDVVNTLEPLIKNPNCHCSYDLEKLYLFNKNILEGKQFVKDKAFSNTIIEIMVEEQKEICKGDKLSDRYGGKGVISEIYPDEFMPTLDNGEKVEIIFNSSTCVNRLNAGQLFETSVNFIGSRLLDYFNTNILEPREELQMYLDFLKFLSVDQYEYLKSFINTIDDVNIRYFMDSIKKDGGFQIALQPMSESMSIDDLDKIYKHFGPVLKPYSVEMPLRDSNGNLRYIGARRTLICGKKYIYRMKQYAEEKFSATSLSATNIRNENTRSRSNKNYKTLYSKTPINFGNMETGNMLHLNVDDVVVNLMVHSASPKARRLTEELLTGDPFNVDIKLDSESRNRNVEILNAYLKTMGLRLVFERIPKVKHKPMGIKPMKIGPMKMYRSEKLKRAMYIIGEEYVKPMMINPMKLE